MKVDLADAVLVLKLLTGLDVQVVLFGDVNDDGTIDMAELLYIMQKVTVLRD